MPAAGEEIFEFRAGLTAWHRAGAAGASQGLQQAVPQRDPRRAERGDAGRGPFVDGAARGRAEALQVQFSARPCDRIWLSGASQPYSKREAVNSLRFTK